jgi:predicted MFS family arabinose efflux permease
MSRLNRLLAVSFLESVAILLVQRGVFFFAHERLKFDDVQNLWLGAAAGVCYVIGALSGHRVTRLFAEKHTLLSLFALQILCCLIMAMLNESAAVVTVGTALIFAFNGMKWAIIESFLTAGQTLERTARIVGMFNVSWSLAVPVGVAAAGPLITWGDSALFLAGLPLSVISMLLILPLEQRPQHLPEDHAQRPRQQIERFRSLLTSARWSLLHSYCLMFLLAPLLPEIFQQRLGFSVRWAPAMTSLMDIARFAAFVFMTQTTFWHGRAGIPVLVALLMPSTFFLVLLGGSVPVVVGGAIVFGFTMGLGYNAALYYAMVVSNGSVDGGGGHESMVGMGFAGGPLSGLLGKACAALTGKATLGMVLGILPAMSVCSAGALWPLLRLRQSGAEPQPVVSQREAL